MLDSLTTRAGAGTLPLTPLSKDRLAAWLKRQPKSVAAWVAGTGFSAAPGSFCFLPGKDGAPRGVLAGMDADEGPWALAGLEVIRRRANSDPLRLKRLHGRFTGMVIPGTSIEVQIAAERDGVVAFQVQSDAGETVLSNGVAVLG